MSGQAPTKNAGPSPLKADELEGLLRHPMGLVIGPGFTLGEGCLAELARDLAAHFNVPAHTQLFSVADAALASGTSATALRDRIREQVRSRRPPPVVATLAKTRWSAVLSACYDPYFENQHQDWCEQAPTRPPVTTIDDLRQAIPPRSIPVYKLLGSANRDDFVITSNDYRVKQQGWQRVLRDFCGFVQGAPVLCAGLVECPWIVLDLMASMLYDANLAPGPLLIHADDPLIGNEQLKELASRGVRILRVEATLRDVMNAATRSRKSAYTAPLPLKDADRTVPERLEQFSDLAVVVNLQIASAVALEEIHRLRDLLFSPAAIRWDPYFHELDLPRTVTAAIRRAIDDACGDKTHRLSSVLVRGPAACGKTTLLKRIAFDIARAGSLVLWLRPYFFQDGQVAIRKLIDCIKDTRASGERPIVVFVDDPVGLGSIRIDDICAAICHADLRACIVTSLRPTDALVGEFSLTTERPSTELDVPDRFDPDEWGRLPRYLLRLGVCSTESEAEAHVSAGPDALAKDVLAMLFWLLPETRQRITSSVRNEHLRLGDSAAFSRLVAGALRGACELLRDAYELVAVASDYGSPVPIEVLVATLGISYEAWLSVAQPHGLLWGLLYTEESPASHTVLYRPRNRVVTDIITEMVNGGVLGHSGELVRLRRLLDACKGSAPAYREFCVRVLVPSDRIRLQSLEYVEGLDLYERAIAALPYEDRTLVHHKGLWQKNKGRAYGEARHTLETALRTRVYPYATRGEPIEHIYTSLAANELDAVKAKAVTVSEGKESVLGFLDHARSASFVNPNAVHVQAKLIVGLADLAAAPTEPDSMKLIDGALSEIDRMLLLLRSQFTNEPERRRQLDMLTDARSEVLDRCLSLEQVRADANAMWEQVRRQDGFVLCGRKLFGTALNSNRGTEFKAAFDYCQGVVARIREANESVSLPLTELVLHVYFCWRVRRRILSESSDAIEWTLLERLGQELLKSSRHESDPFYVYILGLAKAHLGQWSVAHAFFDRLRSRGLPPEVLHEPRDFLMNEKGGMARIQGTIVQGAGKQFLKASALNTDFVLDRRERWARAGETEHVYIRFSFAGPLAVKEP